MTIKWDQWNKDPDDGHVEEEERDEIADEIFASTDTVVRQGDTLMYAERNKNGLVKIYDCQVRRIRWHGPDWMKKGEDAPIVVDRPKGDG